jgi:nucleoid DNA-binding protein
MAKSKIQNITSALSTKYKMPLKDAETFVAMLFDVVNDGLMKDKLVKVKGLGTFKVASVKDRESVNVNTGERVLIEGHDKITFTPDAALRDFVNKPFAQFETVIVKDGVDFSDLDNQKETETQETPDTQETPENKETTETQETHETSDALLSTAAESTEPETPETQETLEFFAEQQRAIDEQLSALKKKVADLEVLPREVVRLREEVAALQKRNRRNLIFACLLIVIAFIAGFFIGRGTTGQVDKQAKPKTPTEATIKAAPADSVETKSIQPAQPAAKQEEETTSFEAYNSDPRIKYGAYDIVGIDTVITLRPGQTLKSVCRVTLGAGMESYLEVMNDAKSLETGKVKVPKLKMRNFKK